MKKRILAMVFVLCLLFSGCHELPATEEIDNEVSDVETSPIADENIVDADSIAEVDAAIKYLELVLPVDTVDAIKNGQKNFEAYTSVISVNEMKYYGLSEDESAKLTEVRKSFFEGEIINLARLYKSEITLEEFEQTLARDNNWYKNYVAGNISDDFATQVEGRWNEFDSTEWFTQAKFATDIAGEALDQDSATSIKNILNCYLSYDDALSIAYEKAQKDLGLNEEVISKANASRSALCAIQIIKILYDSNPGEEYWMD